MRYLFVDLLWNVPHQSGEEKEIYGFSCQLGRAGDRDKKVFGRYLSVEHPELISRQTREQMKNNLTTFRQGWPLSRAVDVLFQTFEEYDILVVWDAETYRMLKKAVERFHKTLPHANVVLIREILKNTVAECGRKISFRRALSLLGVAVEQDTMHQPKYRVKYLYRLFEALEWQLAHIPEEKQVPLVRTRRSGMIHRPDCPNVRGRWLRLAEPKDFCKGTAFCKVCLKRQGYVFYERSELWQRRGLFEPETEPLVQNPALSCPPENLCIGIAKRFENDRNAILEYCAQHGLTCELEGDQLNVSSSIGKWKIIVHGNSRRLWLYHKNTYNKEDPQHPTPIPGYHSQAIHAKKILEYLEYIVRHDAYRKNNPVAPMPKQKTRPKPAPKSERYHGSPQKDRKTVPLKNQNSKKRGAPVKAAKPQTNRTQRKTKKGIVHASSLEELLKLAKGSE